jgi:hypothetical protein
VTRGTQLEMEPYHERMLELLVTGGILELLKQRIGAK